MCCKHKHKVHLSLKVKIQYNDVNFEYRRVPVYNHRLWCPSTQLNKSVLAAQPVFLVGMV